jgi:hypothetical protein
MHMDRLNKQKVVNIAVYENAFSCGVATYGNTKIKKSICTFLQLHSTNILAIT